MIDSVTATIVTCDDSVVVSLLLTDNCTVTGVDQFFELCPGDEVVLGDSTWTESGIYEMHLVSALGCDSVFQVTLTLPDSFEIIGLVWVDVDHNGGISPADTLIPGVSVVIANGSTGQTNTQITDLPGSIQGVYPRAYYQVHIDSSLLAPILDLCCLKLLSVIRLVVQ